KHVVVGKCLEARALSHREVPHTAVLAKEHVLATWYAVAAGFQGLSGPIVGATAVAVVATGTRDADVIRDGGVLRAIHRFGQTRQRVTDGSPRQRRWRRRGAEASYR